MYSFKQIEKVSYVSTLQVKGDGFMLALHCNKGNLFVGDEFEVSVWNIWNSNKPTAIFSCRNLLKSEISFFSITSVVYLSRRQAILAGFSNGMMVIWSS